METIETKVCTPFSGCKDCEMLEIKENTIYTTDGEGKTKRVVVSRVCVNAGICEKAVGIYLKEQEDIKRKTFDI